MSKEEVEALEAQIASAVHAAEDVIESHVSDQILTAYSGQCPPSFLDDSHFLWVAPKITFLIKKMALKVTEKCRLQTVKIHLKRIATEMDMIKKRVMEVKKKRGLKDQQVESAMAEASSSETLTTGNTTSVGFNDYLLQLLNWLTGQQSDRQIIPITGMGGIGKTTLARNAYENSLIVQHFYVHAWVTVSQEFNKKKVFLEILSCLRANTSGNETEEELGEKLYKILSGRRYLIVLDDMWCTDDWDKIHLYFPNNGNGSRIVVTTRICNVGSYFGSLGLALSLLDDDQSWTLFCEKVFGQEGCPLELKKTASRIVKKCRGLPLSIIVIGGLLRNSSREVEHWEYVAKDLSSILSSGEGNQCLNVLFLSYGHLPVRLKPCFLYLVCSLKIMRFVFPILSNFGWPRGF